MHIFLQVVSSIHMLHCCLKPLTAAEIINCSSETRVKYRLIPIATIFFNGSCNNMNRTDYLQQSLHVLTEVV